MRLSKRKRPTLVSMDMTPLIDVVFLLIIFFMTVTQATKANLQALELPKLQGTADPSGALGAITINIDHTGQVTMAGRVHTLGQVRGVIADQVELAKRRGDSVSVALRVDRRAPSVWANDVVRALVELGVSRTRIAVESTAGGR